MRLKTGVVGNLCDNDDEDVNDNDTRYKCLI